MLFPRATPFSCITCVPCSLPGRTEATKACAAPGTQPKPSPAVSDPMSLQPPALVRLKSPHPSPAEEAKLFTGCSGSRLPWGCQMYLVVIGTLLPWLCGCCAWQRQGRSFRKAVYTGGGGSRKDPNFLSGGGKQSPAFPPSTSPQSQGGRPWGVHWQSSPSPIGMDRPVLLTPQWRWLRRYRVSQGVSQHAPSQAWWERRCRTPCAGCPTGESGFSMLDAKSTEQKPFSPARLHVLYLHRTAMPPELCQPPGQGDGFLSRWGWGVK